MGQSIIPVKQLPVVTTVTNPGLNTTIPTEKAVRDAIASTPSPTNATTALLMYNACQ